MSAVESVARRRRERASRRAAAIAPASVLRVGALDILALTGDDACRRLADAPDGARLVRVGFANAHCVNVAAHDAAYRACLSNFVMLPDGVGMDLAARLLYGHPFPENLNGTDFVPRLLGCAPRPWRVALLGGAPGIVEAAAEAFGHAFPHHSFLPVSHGYFGSPAEREAVLDALANAEADVVLVGLGVPRQELLIADHLTPAHARLALAVGALLDFAAGKMPRAPRMIRRLRLEWLFRLCLEPRRLAARYILGNPAFVLRLVRQWLR